MLYGATFQGGAHNRGTIFAFNPATGAETVAYSLAGSAGGGYPNAPLLNLSGVLYGTTMHGGLPGNGTIFKFDPATETFTQLYAFSYNDAVGPISGLSAVGATLYGASIAGGVENSTGTIFSFNLSTNQEKLVFIFPGYPIGVEPVASPHYLGSNLYFTAEQGFQNAPCGQIFRTNPANGNSSTLHTFRGATDGCNPAAAFINIGPILYGSTSTGGPSNAGTLYTFNTANGHFQTIYPFTNGPDGGTPKGRLLQVGNTLYGTTSTGGTTNAGTVFTITP